MNGFERPERIEPGEPQQNGRCERICKRFATTAGVSTATRLLFGVPNRTTRQSAIAETFKTASDDLVQNLPMDTVLARRTALRWALAGLSGVGLFAVPVAAADQSTPLTASDKLSIMELAATFEMALDREDVESYLATFQDDGVLEGVGPKAQGKAALREAFWAMLKTFARGKRHCSMNQLIEGDGQRATMTSYLVVFNRNDLQRGGSALVTDVAEQKNGKWLLASRKIEIDPSLHFGPTDQEKKHE